MSLIPWTNRAMTTFRDEFDELLSRFERGDIDSKLPAVFRRASFPAVNVSETEKSWTVSVELPGLAEKDIHVQLVGRQLVVSGERKWEEEKKGKEFHRVESQFGAFERAVPLPENLRLDPDSITATYKRGMLEVTLQKIEPTPSARIPVKSA